MKKSTFLLNLALLALPVSGVMAQKVPSSMKKVTTVEGITEYSIEKNGMKVLIFPDQSKPTATVNITYMVGSRSEGYGETGMAHLLEHLVFKGSKNHPNVTKEIKDHGANFNGTTWYDRTNYFETFPATDENIEWALSMESDRMINSFIAKKDLDTEMSVVRNEFEMGENDPVSILMERVFSTSYLWHNYGKSTIGNRSDIENVPIENLQAFYRKYYQPDNAILAITGKIDVEKTLALVDRYFATIEKPSRQLPVSYTVEPTQDGERSVTLRRVGDAQVASACYHIPSGSHPDHAALNLLTEILTSEPAGRLYKSMVESKKASSQWGWAMAGKEASFVYFNANVRSEQNLEESKNTLLATLDDLAKNPITKEELQRAKTKTLKDMEQAFRNSSGLGVALSEYMAQGDWRLGFLYRDRTENVTVEDVNRVARTYFKPSNRTVGLFMPDKNPERAEIPNVPDVAAMLVDYKGKAPIVEGEVFDPLPQNIESRTHRGKEASGIQYAFLPKTTRGNTVNLSLTLRIGDEKSLFDKETVSSFAAAMLSKGTKNKTEQQLKDLQDELKASVSVGGSGSTVTVNIETIKNNLPQVIALVNEMLKEPTFPEKEFEQLRQEKLGALETQKSDPEALASIEFARVTRPFPKGDIRYTQTIEEQEADLKAVQLSDVKTFYKNLYGASNATVSVVGDFEEEKVKKAIQDGLGSWKNPQAYTRVPEPFKAVKSEVKTIQTPDKANALYLSAQMLQLNTSSPDFAALSVANYILGGGGLSSRLADRIRQKEGISYGVGSGFSAEDRDDNAILQTYAIYNPDNIERLEVAMKEELERFVKEGVTEKELKDAIESIKQARLLGRSRDASLARKLSAYLDLNRTMQFDENLEKQITNLKADDLNKIIKKYIDPSKFVVVKAGDFKKKVKP